MCVNWRDIVGVLGDADFMLSVINLKYRIGHDRVVVKLISCWGILETPVELESWRGSLSCPPDEGRGT